MKKCLMIAAVLAVCCCLAACDSKFNPSLKLPKGAIYNGSITSEMNIERTYENSTEKIKETTIYEFHLEVTEVRTDGNMAVQLIFDRIYSKSDNNGAVNEYDSKKIGGMSYPAATIVGLAIGMVLTPRAKVAEISGLDAVHEKMIGLFGEQTDEWKNQYRETLQQTFGENTLKQMFERQLDYFPNGPIAVGETWTKQFDMSIGMPMHAEQKLTLHKREGDLAFIGIESTLSPSGRTTQDGNTTFFYNLYGSEKHEITMEVKTGLVVHASSHEKEEGSVTLETAELRGTAQIKLEGDSRFEMVPKK